MPKKAKAASADESAATENYNALVAKATLRGIRLLTSSFEALPTAYKTNDDSERHYGVAYEMQAHRYDRPTNRLTGIFAFKASGSSEDEDFLTIEGEYLIDYELSAECDDDAASLFIKRLGPFAAYPYFRALAGLLTGQAGLVTPPLPLLAEAPRPIDRAKVLRLPSEVVAAAKPTPRKRLALTSKHKRQATAPEKQK